MGAKEGVLAESQNFFAGDKATFRIPVVQDDDTTPQDMSSWTLEFTLSRGSGFSAAVTKTTSSGITITNGSATNDRADVVLDAADTLGLAGNYRYSLRRTDSGEELELAFGDFYIHAR